MNKSLGSVCSLGPKNCLGAPKALKYFGTSKQVFPPKFKKIIFNNSTIISSSLRNISVKQLLHKVLSINIFWCP